MASVFYTCPDCDINLVYEDICPKCGKPMLMDWDGDGKEIACSDDEVEPD